MKPVQKRDKKGWINGTCRGCGVFCVYQLFIWVQALDLEETVFCSLCAGTSIRTDTFRKIGKDLALMAYGQKNSCFLSKRGIFQIRMHRIVHRIKAVLYLLESRRSRPFCFRKAEMHPYWRDIFQYLSNKGAEIAKGFFIAQEEIRSSAQKQKESLLLEKKESKQASAQKDIWEELVGRKSPVSYCKGPWIKCKKTDRSTVKMSEFKKFQNEDSYKAYNMCLSKYYRGILEANGENAFLNSKKGFYKNSTYTPYFYNFKLNR